MEIRHQLVADVRCSTQPYDLYCMYSFCNRATLEPRPWIHGDKLAYGWLYSSHTWQIHSHHSLQTLTSIPIHQLSFPFNLHNRGNEIPFFATYSLGISHFPIRLQHRLSKKTLYQGLHAFLSCNWVFSMEIIRYAHGHNSHMELITSITHSITGHGSAT